jgi:tetratricopeptide (TPR) repeat protein
MLMDEIQRNAGYWVTACVLALISTREWHRVEMWLRLGSAGLAAVWAHRALRVATIVLLAWGALLPTILHLVSLVLSTGVVVVMLQPTCQAALLRWRRPEGNLAGLHGHEVTGAAGLERDAYALNGQERFAEALPIWDELARVATAESRLPPGAAGRAQIGRAFALDGLGRHDQALRIYRDVASRWLGSSEDALRELSAIAKFNLGGTLLRLSRHAEAIETYEELTAALARDQAPGIQQVVAEAFVNEGICTQALGLYDRTIARAAQCVDLFGVSSDEIVQRQVARALLGCAAAMMLSGDVTGALETYDLIEERLGQSPEPEPQAIATTALVEKAALLARIGHTGAAAAICAELRRLHRDSHNRDLVSLLEQAESIRAFCEDAR